MAIVHRSIPPTDLQPGDQLALAQTYVTIVKVVPPVDNLPSTPFLIFYAPGEEGSKGVQCPRNLRVPIKVQ